jgi:hypothetical protein
VPTTERMLTALDKIILTTIHIGGQARRHISKLSETQERIIQLTGCPPDIYKQLLRNLALK